MSRPVMVSGAVIAPRRQYTDVGIAKHECCGPLSLKEAKTAALAMGKGASGDYRVTSPIAHLNGIAARILDTHTA
jgi:hypothetical protein